MIVRKLAEIINSDRDVDWGNGKSRRFLIAQDQMNYSLTDTIVNAGTESCLEYKNHLETCYCIEGEGEIETGEEIFKLEPGTMYALDKNEQHYLRAKTTLRLICVFSPALKGDESHNLSGGGSSSY